MISATPGPELRELPFRSRRNRNPGVRLKIDAHSIRRLRIGTGQFPTTLYATDDAPSQSAVSAKSAYHSVIARAVSKLPNNTREARLALYDRAEIALTAELFKNLEISDERAAVERLAFERAIRKIEDDASKAENPKQLPDKHQTSVLSFFRILGFNFGWLSLHRLAP
jgi:hypothetical protein